MTEVSAEAKAVIAELRAIERPLPRDLAQDRRTWSADAARAVLPDGTEIAAETVGGIPCERVRVGTGQGTVLLLHGGGYVNGAPVTHRKLAAWLARAAGAEVLVPDYRLAPEHPFPAGLEDALAVWRALLGTGPLAMAGDSAGGGLVLALLLKARGLGLPLGRGAFLLSPWTDILATGASYTTNRTADPSMNAERLRESGRWYFGACDPSDPLISPVLADLSGLPPMLIHVGGSEMMLDDSAMLAAHAEAQGVDCRLRIWPGMWHVWHHYAGRVPEADAALAEAGTFLREIFV